jgi:beta-galactosidase beta subunit
MGDNGRRQSPVSVLNYYRHTAHSDTDLCSLSTEAVLLRLAKGTIAVYRPGSSYKPVLHGRCPINAEVKL